MSSRRCRLRTLALLVAALVAAGSYRAGADTLTGEVLGNVLDVQGRGPLPGVTVTLRSSDRGWTRQVVTDGAGSYRFIQLEPGSYSLVFEKEGYYRSERTDILVRLNQPKVVIPAFEMRRTVSTPTRQVTLQGERTKVAVIDLTSPTANTILAFIAEPGATALATLTDAALRFNYDADLIRALPLRDGRSFDQLALLGPGVARVPFSSGRGPAVGVDVGTSGEFAVNGLRGRSNNFTVDGSDNNDEDIGVRRQGFVAAVPQSADSVAEVQIVTAGFPAEFGRNVGSMVNAVSRAGTKELHGSVYGLFDDDALAARSFFDHSFRDTVNDGGLSGGRYDGKDFGRRQAGGVVGGPLGRRQFYFASFEHSTHSGSTLRSFTVPTAAERGLRTQAGVVPIEKLGAFFRDRGLPYSDQAGLGVFSLYPLPNDPLGPFGAHTYSQARPRHGSGDVGSLRLDRYLSARHSFFARYNVTDDRSLLPFTSDAFDSSLGTATRTQNLSLFLNSTAGRFGSALRVSYGRTRLGFPTDEGSPLLFGSTALPSLVPGTPIVTRFGRFEPFGATGPVGSLWITPYSARGVDVFNFPQGRVDNTFQVSEFVTRTGPRHTLKAGVDLRRSQLNSFADRNSRPLIVFGSGVVASDCLLDPTCSFATGDGLLHGTDLAALGAPGGLLQALATVPGADTTLGLRSTQVDLFVQDSWKLRSNLIVSLGLRYDLQRVPSEVNGRLERTFGLGAAQFTRLQPTGSQEAQRIIRAGNLAFDTAFERLGTFLDGRSRMYEPDRNNLAPRVGVAWDPTGRGRMSVRFGYSVTYDAILGAVTSQSRNVFPTFVPMNFDLNFRPPQGRALNSPGLFSFIPTGASLVRRGTLNEYNPEGDAFATALGALLVQAPPDPRVDTSSNGLAITLPSKHLDTASARHVAASVERQIGEGTLISASYVGTSGRNLPRFSSPNAGFVSIPLLRSTAFDGLSVYDFSPRARVDDASRPIRGLGAYTVIEHSARSTYHSAQLAVQHQSGTRLQLRGAWTWSHAIDEVSDPFDLRGAFALPQDVTRPDLERGDASFDVRHRVTALGVWRVPAFGKPKVFEGWRLALVTELQAGQPFTVNTVLDRNQDGNLTDRLDSIAGIAADEGSVRRLRLAPGTSALGLVAPRTKAGRVGRNTFRAAGLATVDAALARDVELGRARLELRLEGFNLFNRTHFGVPVRALESPGFGTSYDLEVDPRSFRLGVKLHF